jgi:hypothetical protein
MVSPVPRGGVPRSALYMLPGQHAGLLRPGNLDLLSRPIVRNPDGSISTVRSITVTGPRGHAYLLPTVVGGRVVPNHVAVQHFQQTGENLGVFANERLADLYAQKLHLQQQRHYTP